jgi:hypothetical protein
MTVAGELFKKFSYLAQGILMRIASRFNALAIYNKVRRLGIALELKKRDSEG